MPSIASPIRVLVVEDEMVTRMDVVEMLRGAGFDILDATNADEAIQMLERNSDIRLIFTDIDMPGSMNGLKLAAAVRDRWPPVRIIATSGHFKKKPVIFRQTPGLYPSPTNQRKLSVLFMSLPARG